LPEILANKNSLTAQYLNGELAIPIPKKRLKTTEERGWLEVLGAKENNLRTLTRGFRSARSPASPA
jgi:excinuclease ABC subunit A